MFRKRSSTPRGSNGGPPVQPEGHHSPTPATSSPRRAPAPTPATKAVVMPTNPPRTPDVPRRVIDIPGAQGRRPGVGGREQEPERRLTVGPDITLTGEISACDHLTIEGRVEAKVNNCRIIEIAPGGTLKGTADVQHATIAGQFQGTLTVSGQLAVTAQGEVSGEIRYRELAVEAGGKLVGRLEPMEPVVTSLPDAREPVNREPGE